MRMRRKLFTGLALGTLVLGAGTLLRAQEEPRFCPDLEQLCETVCERIGAIADKVGLTDEQKTKIREAHTAYADKYQKCRADRKELLSSELQALGQALTPEQREIAKGYVEDFKAAAAGTEGPEICPIRETLADRLHAAIEKINLTPEQRTKIREACAPFAEKHRAQRTERLQLVQDELKSVSEVLTPEQRAKVRSLIEARMVHSPVAQSVAERMHAQADPLGINSEQLTKIRDTHRGFVDQYDALYDERDHLLQEEFKAIGAILTPEQREKVSNYFADRVVMVGGDLSRLDEGTITQLRESVAERLDGVADKLGLSAEQKEKIKEAHAGFVPTYRAQRDKRRELRQKELDALSALLTPEQREKVKDFVGDKIEAPKSN
jgi:Spy/CpxP family protein refolding chaperone